MTCRPRAAWLAGLVSIAACADDGEVPGASASDTRADGAGSTAGTSEVTGLGSTSLAPDDDDDDDDDTTGGTSTGKPVAFANFCEPCHGSEGQGTAFGYELQHPSREHAMWVVRNGREGLEFPMSSMAAFEAAVVDDETLDAIFDWLDGQPQPRAADALYLDYCANCHGADGSGGSVGRDIRGEAPGTVAGAVRRGRGLDMLGVRERYMPAVDAAMLTDDELTSIADHVGTL